MTAAGSCDAVSLHLKAARQAGENVPDKLFTTLLSPHGTPRCVPWPTAGSGRAAANDGRPGPQKPGGRRCGRNLSPDAPGREVVLHWMDATVGREEWGAWNDPAPSSRHIVVRVAGEDTYVGWKDRNIKWCGDRAQAEARGVDPDVLDLADANGTSSPDYVFGYGVTTLPARGGGRVARADLRRYAQLLLDGADDDDERVAALIVPGDR